MPDLLSSVQLVTDGPAFDALGLVHRVRVPAVNGPHQTLIMLHGLQGDENVTWVFARSLSPQWLIVSPRAPFPAENGYTWSDPGMAANDPAAYKQGLAALEHFIQGLPDIYHADLSRLVLLGFSQGAAVSYAMAVTQPIQGIAALSGFVPTVITDRLSALKGIPILILHGTKDERIPVEQARHDRDQLTAAGAQVAYHEEQVGHKVSANGLHELRRWLAERLDSRA